MRPIVKLEYKGDIPKRVTLLKNVLLENFQVIGIQPKESALPE